MKVHKLTPNTPEWLAYRDTMFNASDAPAMMGCSAYKTRSQLLHERATGQMPTVNAGTQRRFDEGHRIEALARPLAEKIIGQDLYPQVGSEGEYSASFDGLSMDESENFEHKTLNDELRAAFAEMEIYSTNDKHCCLPEQYQVQMEQQHMVSGCTRTLFMASKWDGDTLVEEQHCWYYTDMALRAKIVAGWAQFKIDLAAYVPPVITVAPVAKAVASLPVVFDMRVEGKLVSCNLEQYKPAALAYIEAINTELVTDQNFADADADAKFCRDSADKLEFAIEQALGQMGDINSALNMVREIAAAFDAKGLALEKLVKAEKENRRNTIISEAAAEFVTHMRALNERLGGQYMPTVQAEFQLACKGLKSIDSTKAKVSQELARVKIESSGIADRIQANLQILAQHADMAFLFNDKASIVLKQPEDFAMLVRARVAEHQAELVRKEEAQREKIRAEEQAKAEKDARDKLAAEQAEIDRIERKRRSDADALAAQHPQADAPPAPAISPAPAAAITHEAVVSIMPASVRQAMSAAPAPVAVPTDKPAGPPTMSLGAISERLGFNVTSAFLASLGFEATTVKASKLFHESDFNAIGKAIIEHIESVCELQPA